MGIIIFLCKVNFPAGSGIVVLESRDGFGRLDHFGGEKGKGRREKK